MLVLVVVAATGCGSADLSSDEGSATSAPGAGAYGGVPSTGGSATYYGGTGGGTAGTGTGGMSPGSGGSGIIVDPDAGPPEPLPPPPPPEEEEAPSFKVPVTTGEHIWAANPQSGYVARINARDSSVQVVGAGWAPTYLAAVPDPTRDAAIVLNASSNDATLMPVADDGTVHDGNNGFPSELETYPTHQGANAWALSGDGHWAIAWTDYRESASADPAEGFQEITIIDLVARTSTQLSVGWRPVSVSFNGNASQAATRAFAVTEDGISAVALDDLSIAAIDVTDQPLDVEAQPDVTITPNGAWGLVRIPVSPDMDPEVAASLGSWMGFVDLTTREISTVQFAGYATDLDLSEDGTMAVAAVYRPADPATARAEEYYVVTIPVPAPGASVDVATAAAWLIEGHAFRQLSLSPSGNTAVLYTRDIAGSLDRVTIFQSPTGTETDATYRTVDINAPARAAFVTPDSAHAIVTQDPPFGSTRAGAFSIVPLQEEIWPKLVGTDAEPQSVIISQDGSYGLVTVSGATTFGVHAVEMPSLRDDFIQLASAPLATGIVEQADPLVRKGYVAQEHPEGRITLIELPLVDPPARTITGFEINAQGY